MGRASKSEQRQHRQSIVDIAARQVKARGIEGLTIPDVMAAAGLTPGGFYGHFASKAELSAQAVTRAFDIQSDALRAISDRSPGGHPAAMSALVDFYFSDVHRTDLERSCPMAALSADVARERDESPARYAFIDGIERNLSQVASLGDGEDDSVSEEQREEALVAIATAVGAIVMARATAGRPISDEIVAAVRRVLP